MRKESSGPVGVEVGSFTVLLRVASTSREHFMIVAFMQPATSTSQGTESSLIVRDSACIRCVARSMATDKQLPACKRCSQMQGTEQRDICATVYLCYVPYFPGYIYYI